MLGDSFMLSAGGKFWPPLSRCETHTSKPPLLPRAIARHCIRQLVFADRVLALVLRAAHLRRDDRSAEVVVDLRAGRGPHVSGAERAGAAAIRREPDLELVARQRRIALGVRRRQIRELVARREVEVRAEPITRAVARDTGLGTRPCFRARARHLAPVATVRADAGMKPASA